MLRTLITATTLLLATTHVASANSDCIELGLPSDFLTKFYCKELQAIIDENGGTRSYGETTSSPNDPIADGPWANIKSLKEAYRADPSKTLELIKRIKSAGGLTEE